MYRDCDTYSSTILFWWDKRGEDGDCEEWKISEKVMFAKRACETIACVGGEWMVFPSDSRTHGWVGILYHCFSSLMIAFRWLSKFIVWFLASIVGVDYGFHLAIKNHTARTWGCIRPSSMGKYFVPNMHNFCIYTRTPVVLFERFEEWIWKRSGTLYNTFNPLKINMSHKLDGPLQNESMVFQPSLLRSKRQAVSFRGSIYFFGKPSRVHGGSTTRTGGTSSGWVMEHTQLICSWCVDVKTVHIQ